MVSKKDHMVKDAMQDAEVGLLVAVKVQHVFSRAQAFSAIGKKGHARKRTLGTSTSVLTPLSAPSGNDRAPEKFVVSFPGLILLQGGMG